MNELTAWHDVEKHKEVLESPVETFYYAVYATNPEERRKWINAYIKEHILNDRRKSEGIRAETCSE